jgi:hypothetical protein
MSYEDCSCDGCGIALVFEIFQIWFGVRGKSKDSHERREKEVKENEEREDDGGITLIKKV